ncbi:MAG TPA: hypothetical protein VJQ44_09180 [Gemmatimonadales bacterium]|nr:hypothetical protein [Gemmatimonadales bacterium]
MTDSPTGSTHRQVSWLVGLLLFFGAAAFGPAHTAQAQSSLGRLYDRWQIDLAGAVVIMGTTIRVDGSEGEGTDVNSDDLGLPSERLMPRVSVRWRPGHRHELELGYQFVRRTGEKTLDREIVFGDSTYDVGLATKSKFREDQAFVIYRFAIQAKERTQLGVGVGLGALPFKYEIDALTGTGSESVTSSRVSTYVAPTGSIGAYGRFVLDERWYLETDLRGMAVKIDRTKARIVEGNLAGRYFLSGKLALELGYGISSIRLTVDPRESGRGFSGRVKYPLQNVRAGVVLTP